jgi:hypothetical protein
MAKSRIGSTAPTEQLPSDQRRACGAQLRNGASCCARCITQLSGAPRRVALRRHGPCTAQFVLTSNYCRMREWLSGCCRPESLTWGVAVNVMHMESARTPSAAP